MRLIDEDVFIKNALEHSSLSPSTILLVLENTPTVDAAPVVHGKWCVNEADIHRDDDGAVMDADVELYCSVCGEYAYHEGYKFCPYCGARMDGQEQILSDDDESMAAGLLEDE